MPVRFSMTRALAAALLAATITLPAAAPRAQELSLGVDASPAGLDPHIVTAFTSFQVVNGTIYEALTGVDAGLRIIPVLAESWTAAPDGRSFTFRLRRNVTFHNGRPMEAADVVASFNRVLAREIASPLASRLAAVDTTVAVDANTVEVRLKEPSATLLSALSSIAIVPRGLETDRESLQRQPVGTGPFKFAEWQPNSFIRLERHAGYWGQGRPRVAGLRFVIVPESATRQVGIASGQFAMLPNIDAATALQLRGRPNVRLHETLELAYTMFGLNVERPPLNNPRVREAINHAIDRSAIIQAALFGAGVPGGPLSPALRDWALPVSDFGCYRHDPARARALLAEAGVTTPITLRMNVLPRQDIRDIAQVVQQQLGAVGIRVELVNMELGQFIQEWRASNFDMFASTNAGAVDPDDYFFRTFRTGGSTNVFKYSNTEVDGLLDRARQTLDQAARKRDYDQVQRILACTGPIVHLAYSQLFTAARTNVDGFEILANRSLVSLGAASVR